MRCLVTGATGAVGPDIVEALLDHGHDVTILSRVAPVGLPFRDRIRTVAGDITISTDVNRAAVGQEAVIHLAALLHVNNPTPERMHAMKQVNVVGTKNVIAAAKDVDAQRLILMSTIAVYGYDRGILFTERVPPEPQSYYAKTKLEAEGLAQAAFRRDGTPLCTVLRPAAVYGPRIKGNYRTLLNALARRRFIQIGRGTSRRTLVHSLDLAQAVCLVLQNDHAVGKVYNVTDGEYHQLSAILTEMCRALGRDPPTMSIPIKAARLAASTVDRFTTAVGRNTCFSELLNKYLEEVAVDGNTLEELGFRPALDLRQGWQQTVSHLRSAGEL